MRKNKLKEIWNKGGVVYCGWLHIPNTWSAEVMANADWDCLTVDLQHGLHSIETAIQMLQAISTTDQIPLARVNWNEPGSIMRMLDGGAYGIICPMVNNKEECEAFVKACRYPPWVIGVLDLPEREFMGGMDYGDFANDEILTFAMAETKEAVENIDAICSVEGLDAIFVGTGDLRFSLTGTNKPIEDNSLFDKAIDAILASCKKHDIVPGVWVPNIEAAKAMKEKGYRFIALKSDSMILMEYAKKLASELKEV